MLRIFFVCLAVVVRNSEGAACTCTVGGSACSDVNTYAECVWTESSNNPCDVAEGVANSVKAISCAAPGDLTDTCLCQKAFLGEAGDTPVRRCPLYDTLIRCVAASSSATACGSQTKADLVVAIQANRAAGKDACTNANACITCRFAYHVAKAGASGNGAKCTALNTYINCLQLITTGGVSSQTVCIDATSSAEIKADNTAATCATTSSDSRTCICMKNFFSHGDLTVPGNACTANDEAITCLTNITPTSEKSCLTAGNPTQESSKQAADAFKESTTCKSLTTTGTTTPKSGSGHMSAGVLTFCLLLLTIIF